MAAIVYLDVDDEITSAAARIRALEEDRIALVLPLGSRLATSRINFRLLAREAEARGKRIEVITNDASARALAASAGLPTHLSVAAFEAPPAPSAPPAPAGIPAPVEPHGPAAGPSGSGAAPESEGAGAASAPGAADSSAPPSGTGRTRPASADDDSPTLAMPVIKPPADYRAPVPQVGRRPPRRRGPVIAAIALLGVLVLVIGTAAFALLPSAEIVVAPASDTVGPLELNVTAQSGITNPDPANLLIPASRFTFDLDVSDTFDATGIKVDETTASGEVTFQNCYTSPVTITEGSIVGTRSGITFRTQSKLSLKKATFFPFPDCPTGKVAIVASAAGSESNVGVGQITVIPEGFDPENLRVTNEQPTAGGTHTETKQIQQSDIDAALVTLDAALATEFDLQISNATEVPEGTTLFAETKALGEATPSVDPATLVGTDAEQFELGLTAQGTVTGADPRPVETLARARIRTAVDDGFRLVEDSITVETGTPIVAGSVITFPVTVRALELRIVDGPALLARVRGLGLPQARTILEAYGDVTISVWPDWVTTIPTLEGRATLRIGEPALPSASPGADAAGTSAWDPSP